jgi:hypothetical protein
MEFERYLHRILTDLSNASHPTGYFPRLTTEASVMRAASRQSAHTDYYAITMGMNRRPAKRLKVEWKPMQKLNVRPNIRYDRADGIGAAFRPFDGKKNQFLFSLDATIPF